MNRTAQPTHIAALALIVLVGVALAAGCASTPSGPAATKTPTPAGTAATAATSTVTTAASSGSGSNPGSAGAAVGASRLKAFIPKTAGDWKLESDPTGMTGKDASGNGYSWIIGIYKKSGDDNVEANIQIHDLATAESPLKSMWQTFTSSESSDGGYMKSTTIKGFPAWDVYDKPTKDYSMMIGVGTRYIVYITVEKGTKADLDALVNAMDIPGLAALK